MFGNLCIAVGKNLDLVVAMQSGFSLCLSKRQNTNEAVAAECQLVGKIHHVQTGISVFKKKIMAILELKILTHRDRKAEQ